MERMLEGASRRGDCGGCIGWGNGGEERGERRESGGERGKGRGGGEWGRREGVVMGWKEGAKGG